MTITAEEVDQALKIVQRWRTSAHLGAKKKAEKECELVVRVIRGLSK